MAHVNLRWKRFMQFEPEIGPGFSTLACANAANNFLPLKKLTTCVSYQANI
ncbi:hypothetical protein AGRO_3259 [Agrobacterium sp. ATCC 31749]|nr:hypothetical protein AGRO_3259 [Agrobacterium sp. ATCC 31749]